MAKGLSGTKLKSPKAQNIVEDILAISGDYGPEAVFCDWVEMMAIAIQNACSIHNATWESREQMYLRVMKKYPGLEERFSQMTALFVECMEECMDDYLGQSYMAAGKPVIAASNGEIPKVIRASSCGFCAQAGDADGLAQAVRDFLATDDKDRLGSNARKYYEENFTRDMFMSKLECELKDACGD